MRLIFFHLSDVFEPKLCLVRKRKKEETEKEIKDAWLMMLMHVFLKKATSSNPASQNLGVSSALLGRQPYYLG